MPDNVKRDPTIHYVDVAKGIINSFDPDTINGSVGDIITFRFYPQNHTVVRADYKAPCVPYETIHPGGHGFFSGFHSLDMAEDPPPMWNLTINDTLPSFFYCTSPDSCIKNMMVGVINPNSSVSLDVQKAYAMNSSYMLLPGEPIPAEGSSTSGMPFMSMAMPTTTPTVTATPAPSSQPDSSSSGSLSGGAIAGIVTGVVALVAAVVLGRSLILRHFLSQGRKPAWGRIPYSGGGPPAPPPPAHPPQNMEMNIPYSDNHYMGASMQPMGTASSAYPGSPVPTLASTAGSIAPYGRGASMSPQHFGHGVSPPASPPPQFPPVEAPGHSKYSETSLMKPMPLEPQFQAPQELHGSDTSSLNRRDD